ncbi:MAG: hypothetical protein K6G84_09885 [Lachnospiraceae bacterium]|nr:hypothetical protein [Lachnospiraceae bacterium]
MDGFIRKKWIALLLSISMVMTSNVVAYAAESTEEIVAEAVLPSDEKLEVQSSSANYSFVSKQGHYLDGMDVLIGAGNKIKFELGDENGNKMKGARKQAEWSVTNPTYFSIKNGVLKCSKKAAEYNSVSWNSVASTTLYAKYNGESISLNFIAVPRAKTVGYIQSDKFRNQKTIVGKAGSTFDLRQVNNMVGDGAKVFVSYKVAKKGLIKKYYSYAYLENTNPYISTPAKTIKGGTVSYDSTGSVCYFTPTEEGKYKFTYTMRDGSNKKFSITIKIK